MITINKIVASFLDLLKTTQKKVNLNKNLFYFIASTGVGITIVFLILYNKILK